MDPASQIIYIIVLVALLAFSAFFSASETIFSTVNVIKLKKKADEGNKRATKAIEIAENFDETISTILIGNNIVNILETSIATTIFTIVYGVKGLIYSTITMTVSILIFGELLPKTIAKRQSLKLSLIFAAPLKVCITLFKPVTLLFKMLTRIFIKPSKEEPTVTEEELVYMIDKIAAEGVLERAESDLIKLALEFDDKTIDDIYTKKEDIFAIDLNDSSKLYERIIKNHFSRIPVYINDLDNIVGIIQEKDILTTMIEKEKVDIKKNIQNPMFLRNTIKIDKAFRKMQREKNHIAIVKDSDNKTLGLITMEDLLESLVGEIYDEFDDLHK